MLVDLMILLDFSLLETPHYGGISVLWTSEYELDSSVAGYYYVVAEGSAPYFSALAQGEAL